DIDPELPGMGGFDHAIVRARLDARDVWIDMTEDLLRPGELPIRDQGRRVLVIADDTKGLVTTPAPASSEQTVREVRTFTAAEHGPAKLTEVTRATGVFERNLRRWYRESRGDDVRKSYIEYAENEYRGALDRVASSDADDLGTPFEITVAVNDARRVYAERYQIDAYLYPSAVLQHVPTLLTEKSTAPRTRDFAWPIPHLYEVENRIVVPRLHAAVGRARSDASAGASDVDRAPPGRRPDPGRRVPVR